MCHSHHADLYTHASSHAHLALALLRRMIELKLWKWQVVHLNHACKVTMNVTHTM